MNNNRDIKNIINKMDVPLSSDDIYKILNGKCKIIIYPELLKYNTIDELFDDSFDCVVILYMHNKIVNGFYGHWCCIFKIDNKTIEFFDSYGKFCDDQLNSKIDTHFRKEYGLEYPLLTYLLYYTANKYKLTFNHHKYQGPTTSTCGRHCCVRLLNRHMKLSDYNNYINSYDIAPDLFVTILTNNILSNNI